MKRRAYLAIALAATSIIGCAALVGIGDLPIDASAPHDSSTSAEDASTADVGSDEAASVDHTTNEDAPDDALDDVSTKDGALRDVEVRETGARDASTDRVSMDGPTLSTDASPSDASDASVDRKPIPDASIDRSTAASCALAPADAGATCATCLQAECCSDLEVCQLGDEAGVDDAGQSACIRLANITLVCTVAVGDSSSTCTQANLYTPSEQKNATALVTCLQQSCPVQCNDVIAVPGI